MEDQEFFRLIPRKKTVRDYFNRERTKCLIFRHSHIAITDYHLGDNPEFEKSVSSFDEMTWKYKRAAGYYVKALREFRIPRSYDTSLLAKFFQGYTMRVDNDDAVPPEVVDTKLLVPPRDDSQVAALSFLCSQGDFANISGFTYRMLDLTQGAGKTFCCVAASCFMRAKTVVVVPIGKLVDQWVKSFLDFTSLEDDEIAVIQGSGKCLKLLNGHKSFERTKVFIFMVDTIVSFSDRYGDLATIEMFQKTGAYLTVLDEVHLEMKAFSRIHALLNTHMTILSSATPGRSSRKENWIFKCCYRHVPRFGSGFMTKDERFLDILVAAYHWVPTPKQSKLCVQRRTGWLNGRTYEKELLNSPEDQSKSFFRVLKNMLLWSRRQLKPEYRLMILCATREGTHRIADFVKRECFPNDTVAPYYATGMAKEDKEAALNARIIVATEKSMGTGADIKGLQHVYNVSTYANWIAAGQNPGRARKLADGTQVVYVELVNFGWLKTQKQFEKRRGVLVKKSRTGQLMVINE